MSIKDILARHHLLDHVVLSRPIDVLLSALEPTVPPAEPDPHGIIEGDVNLVDDLSKSPIPGFDFALGQNANPNLPWPKQYLSAKAQLERNLQREKEAAAANAGLTPQQIAAKLLDS